MSDQPSDPVLPAAGHAKPEFWRRTPPALFPSIFGLMGLGMAWRAAAGFEPFAVSQMIGQVILLGSAVLYMFVLACYLSKISLRPRVILEDMTTVPGRAGIAAMSLSLLLFSAAVQPLSVSVATAALFLGLAAHSVIALLAIWMMLRSPQGLVVSPAWHLNFVGFIIAPLSAVALGYAGLAQMILGVTVLVAAMIYGISLLQMSKGEMPPPLRPLLAIHLAPVSLFTTVAVLLDRGIAALLFGALSVGLVAVLVSRLKYVASAGFSPLWGAFTFPLAAFASALFALGGQVALIGWCALLPLAVASIATPVIVVRILVMWANGALATKTGAAVA